MDILTTIIITSLVWGAIFATRSLNGSIRVTHLLDTISRMQREYNIIVDRYNLVVNILNANANKPSSAVVRPPSIVIDAYIAMGLDTRADFQEVKNRFRSLMKKYHPDNKTTGSTAKFAAINQAYNVLKQHLST